MEKKPLTTKENYPFKERGREKALNHNQIWRKLHVLALKLERKAIAVHEVRQREGENDV